MKIQTITINPDPYKPFRLAQGYRVGELLFISGQAAIDGTGQLVGIGNFDAQAEQVFANLDRVLRAGGSSLANVIKVTIFSSGTCRTFQKSSSCGAATSRLRIQQTRSLRSRPSTHPRRCSRLRRSPLPTRR